MVKSEIAFKILALKVYQSRTEPKMGGVVELLEESIPANFIWWIHVPSILRL